MIEFSFKIRGAYSLIFLNRISLIILNALSYKDLCTFKLFLIASMLVSKIAMRFGA